MEVILGNKFINSKFEEQQHAEIFKAPLICLFFTAKWCSPCEIFAKDIIEVYDDANEGEKVIEIIQLSFDKTEQEFKSCISDKPWIFIPFNDERIEAIANKYEVRSIPVFLLLDGNGNVISENCRKEISEQGVKVVDSWLKLVGKGDK